MESSTKFTSLEAQALQEKKKAVIRKYSGRLFYKIDTARSIRMLVQMDCPKEWYTEINNFPMVLQSTLNPTNFLLTRKLCEKLDIPFDIIKKKKKKQVAMKPSKSLLERYDEICGRTASSTQKENIEPYQNEVHVKIPITKPVVEQRQDANSSKLDVSKKRSREGNKQSQTALSKKKSVKPHKKTAMYKSCFNQALKQSAQFKKVIKK